MSQLHDLARPFPSKFIHGNPSGGGSYVKHHVVDQRLLQVVGPFDWEKVEVIRGFVPGKPPNPNGASARAKAGTPDLPNAIVGVVCRLTVEIDGRRTVVEEAGDCEEPNNWPHDGARLKDAMSDALKRCAMRFGCGLHLWSQDEYFLFSRLGEEGVADAAPPPHVDRETGEITSARPTPAAQEVGGEDGRDRKGEATESKPVEVSVSSQAGGTNEPPGSPRPASPMTPNAQRRLFAMLKGAGVTDAQRHAWAAERLGRPVATFSDLSADDGKVLMGALESLAAVSAAPKVDA